VQIYSQEMTLFPAKTVELTFYDLADTDITEH